MNDFIPQTGGRAGIVDGSLLLVRTYADGTLTAATRGDRGWGPEFTLAAELVQQ